MSSSAAHPQLDRSAIVARLRAAGCVFAEDEAQILISAATTLAGLAIMVDRRAAGLPLEHVLGWAEFCGLRIAVDPGVFVPRRRTEFLVREASALARPGSVVVDLCCGSGAIAAAIAAIAARSAPAGAAVPASSAGPGGLAELHAVDIDPAAVRCARRNLAAGAQVYEGDLYEPLPARLRGHVDVLVASPPYVPAGEVGLLPREARMHESQVALDGGPDGLEIVRRVIAAAPQWLAPGGHLLIEMSEHQASRAAEAVARRGLVPRVASSAELDATVVIGTRPASQREPDRRHDRPQSMSEVRMPG